MVEGGRVDRGRVALYEAELAAFDGTRWEALVPFVDLREQAQEVLEGAWWPGGPVEVRRARRGTRSSSTRSCGGEAVLSFADNQLTLATLAHELAHALAGGAAGHGPVYRRAYLDLVSVVCGAEPQQWLAQAFASFGLVVGERRWRPPPANGESPFAL